MRRVTFQCDGCGIKHSQNAATYSDEVMPAGWEGAGGVGDDGPGILCSACWSIWIEEQNIRNDAVSSALKRFRVSFRKRCKEARAERRKKSKKDTKP